MFLRYISGFIIGSLLGGLIGYLAKCASGTCPITSNTYITVLIGGMMGIMLVARPPEKTEDREQSFDVAQDKKSEDRSKEDL